MKELTIGEELHIRCVEDIPGEASCANCVFKTIERCNGISCYSGNRSDYKNVHFELIEY